MWNSCSLGKGSIEKQRQKEGDVADEKEKDDWERGIKAWRHVNDAWVAKALIREYYE